jgi:hypothetical protein
MAATREIHLPETLCAAVEQKFGHRFGSLEETVSAILSQLVRDDALIMDAREQQIIEERLKGLGYI